LAANQVAPLRRERNGSIWARIHNAFEQSLRHGSYRYVKAQTASMLEAIATRKLPVRPDRVEPQAVKRRPKRHPLLQVPRDIARAQILRKRNAQA
jgi:hypothetical protein